MGSVVWTTGSKFSPADLKVGSHFSCVLSNPQYTSHGFVCWTDEVFLYHCIEKVSTCEWWWYCPSHSFVYWTFLCPVLLYDQESNIYLLYKLVCVHLILLCLRDECVAFEMVKDRRFWMHEIIWSLKLVRHKKCLQKLNIVSLWAIGIPFIVL